MASGFRERTTLLLGEAGMERLELARVCVFGLGGVGAAAAAVGATSLLISDSTIGILRYFHDFTGGPLFVMTTYFVGQWLIASGQGGATIVPPDQK